MTDSNTCPVCMDTYTKEIRLRIQCPYCPSAACKGCVSRYLLTTYDDPHCMQCKKGWSREFLDTHLTKTFRTGDLKKHRAKILMEREKAFLPAHQIFVEGLKEIRRLEPLVAEANKKHDEIVVNRRKILIDREKLARALRTEQDPAKQKEIREQLKQNAAAYGSNEANVLMQNFDRTELERMLYAAQIQYNGTNPQQQQTETREFIQRCPADGCRGYLSTAYKCGVCAKFTCPECLAVKGDSRDVEHTCNEEAKASAALIRRETKPCPKCGVRIYKIDGCFAKDTPILCWNGHYKMSQDIRVGDVLVGDDGESRTVEELCSGGDEMFEVSQGKGMTYVVNSKHKLALKFSGEKSIHWSESENAWKVRWFDRNEHVMKTKKSRITALFNKEEAYHMLKAFCNALEFSEIIEITVDEYTKLTDATKKHLMGFKSTGINWPAKDVPLDPYLLGLWLGDGINDGMSFAVNPEADPEILQFLLDWCEQNGAELVHDEAYRFRIRRREVAHCRLAIGRGASCSECKGCKEKMCNLCDIPNKHYTDEPATGLLNPLKEQLDKYGLPRNPKFIPNEYLINSREIRLQLLAGLIDTDGFVGNNGKRIQISQANHNLGKQIEFLARSLGFVVHVDLVKKNQIPFPNVEEKKDYNAHYRVNISGERLSDIPTRVARKKCVNSNSTKDELRTSISVKPVGKGTYYGWSVNGNKRFLLADFTVARNCDQMWCTQEGCHTAFSWRTGHIVTGVVHNPHYYEYLRSRNGGQMPREAGDIPCGGLPQVWTLSRRVQGVVGLTQLERQRIYNMHRGVSDVLYERLPQFPARRPAGLNRDINIRYLMNEMSDDEWKKMLEQRESKCEKKKEIGQILTMFTQVASEQFQALERERNDAQFVTLWRDVVSKHLEDLRIYTNKCLADLGKRMICAIPQIDKDWIYIPPRKEALKENVTPAPAAAVPASGFPPTTPPPLVPAPAAPPPAPRNTIITRDDYVPDEAIVVE